MTQPLVAGVLAAVVGFASTFALVLQGLIAVGASQAEAASGLLALLVVKGLLAVGLGLRFRMPISIAWSSPGAALLVATAAPAGGFPAAAGASGSPPPTVTGADSTPTRIGFVKPSGWTDFWAPSRFSTTGCPSTYPPGRPRSSRTKDRRWSIFPQAPDGTRGVP